MDPAVIPSFLKALTQLIALEPGIGTVEVNQKLHALGWDDVTMDYHCLQIAIACLETDA